MFRRLLVVAALAACIAGLQAQEDVLGRIKAEAMDRSQVMTFFDHFVTVIGPRLTGSPQYKAAADWSRGQLEAMGLENARLEPFEFGRGWVLDRLVVELVEPHYMPLIAYAEGWSAPTTGEIVATPVLAGGKTAAEVAAMKDTLAGAIVFSQPLVTAFVREDRPQPSTSDTPVRPGAPPMPRQGNARPQDTRAIAQAIRDARPGVVVRSSAGEHGTVFVLGRDQGENAIPSVVLAAEHYNMIARMVERGLPVKMRVNVQARYLTGDTNSYNVLADIPGTDPVLRDEVVLLGAHLDSWHSATGATDNADGSAAVIEAMRILKTIGVRPRRTIRVALWGGEEQGLLGSRAHIRMHYAGEANASARGKLALYLNIDPGMGPIYGWYSEGSAPARVLFDKWIAPMKDLGVRKNVDEGLPSTDHVAFRDAGMPGFSPIQDYVTYDVRTHHTNVDTYERVREEDLKQNAAVLAWFIYNAAMTDERIPPPAPRTPASSRVLVFNIHAGKDAAGKPNLEEVSALVRKVDADLVLLQEVDRGTRRSGSVDQVETLGGLTSYAAAFGRSLDYDGGLYGIAALSRRPIGTHTTEALPIEPPQARAGGSYEPRAALTLATTTAIGPVRAINTHLDASRDERYRLQESRHIVGMVKTLEPPVVVGGDFNAEPGSETYKQLLAAGLRDAWKECGAGDGFTYPADKPIKRIDYLFLTGDLRCSAAEVIDTRISDHRPLLVTLAR